MNRHLEYPDLSIYGFLRSNSEKRYNLTALNYFGKKFTYKTLIENIIRTSKALKALGVKKGDKVSICLPNIPEAIYTFYAINRIGAVANMIHPMSAENEIVHYLTVSGSRFVIGLDLSIPRLVKAINRSNVERFVVVSVKESMPLMIRTAYSIKVKKIEMPSDSISWKEFIKLADNITDDEEITIDKEDCAAILYSGGTTGKPKGIMLSNYNFNVLAIQSIDACGNFFEGTKILSVMPIFHGFGLGVCIHTALYAGGEAIILPSFKASEFHKLLFKYKPNVIAAVPAVYESFLKSNVFEGKDLSFLQCIISGGDSLSVNTKKKMDELLRSCNCNTEVREGYGQTECVTGSCLLPEGVSRPGSCGLPYADTFYKIIDINTGAELPSGETGEIILRGPSVMIGYLNDPEETNKTLEKRDDGYTWLHTGDMGYIDEEGYVYFKQRLKRMIISGGYNIYPQVIENVIDSNPNVLMCAVIGMPDQVMGELCKAFIEFKDQDIDKDRELEAIKAEVSKNVARYAQPREYIIVDHLPRTLVGKIAYNDLIEKYKDM